MARGEKTRYSEKQKRKALPIDNQASPGVTLRRPHIRRKNKRLLPALSRLSPFADRFRR